jgi:MFS family permease
VSIETATFLHFSLRISHIKLGGAWAISGTNKENTMTRASTRCFRMLVCGLILASAAVQFALVPVLPVYTHRFGLSGFQQGEVLGAPGLAALAVCLPAGALSDRFGARRMTLCAGALMAIGTLAQGLAGNVAVLLAARLFFGAGYGIVWTAGLCWLAAASGATTIGGSVTSGGIGGVLGPAAAGVLVQRLGLDTPWLLAAAAFAALTVGLAVIRTPAGPVVPASSSITSLRTVARNRGIVWASAAVITAGLTNGVCSLLAPDQLHAAGASTARIGLDFAIAGIVFAAGSALTAWAGRRALTAMVICGGILAEAVAFSLTVASTATLAILAMLFAVTAARSLLWTVSYPLAATSAEQDGMGLGAVVGLLNGIWAASAVAGPLAAGLATEHLGARATFALTGVTCVATLALAAAMAWRARTPAATPNVNVPMAPSVPSERTNGAIGTLWRAGAAGRVGGLRDCGPVRSDVRFGVGLGPAV